MSTFTGRLGLSVFRKVAPPRTQLGQHIVIKNFDPITTEFHIRIFDASHGVAGSLGGGPVRAVLLHLVELWGAVLLCRDAVPWWVREAFFRLSHVHGCATHRRSRGSFGAMLLRASHKFSPSRALRRWTKWLRAYLGPSLGFAGARSLLWLVVLLALLLQNAGRDGPSRGVGAQLAGATGADAHLQPQSVEQKCKRTKFV